jgi:PAS domain S-box-containing protein
MSMQNSDTISKDNAVAQMSIDLRAELENRIRFETLIADISAHFVRLPSSEVDGEIERALKQLLDFFDVDICGILAVRGDKELVLVTHACYAEGIEPVSKDINMAKLFPWSYEELTSKHLPVRIERLTELPPEAEQDRLSCLAMGFKSYVTIPLSSAQGVRYLLTIESVLTEHDWPNEFIPRLNLLGEIFVNALERRNADQALRESEARLNLAADSAGAGLWMLDVSTGGFWLTEKTRELFSFPSDREISFDYFLNIVHPDDREQVCQAVDHARQLKEKISVQYRIIRPDGSIRWIAASGRFHSDASNESNRLMGVSIDITERKRAEKQLAERLQFETLLTDLSAGFINSPADQVDASIEDAQRRVCECLGLDLSALWQFSVENPHLLALTHIYRPLGGPPLPEPMDAQEYFPWCQKQLSAGQSIILSSIEKAPAEAVRDRETWRHFGIKTTLTIPLAAGGGPTFGAVSFNDIRKERQWTEPLIKKLELVAQVFANALARKRSEQALHESEERLSMATDSAGVGLWIMDMHTQKVWVTPKLRELFNFTSDEEVSYESFFKVIHPEDREVVHKAVEQALHNKEILCVEYRVVLPEGKIRWISVRGRPYFNSSGEPDRLMGVSIDITARKKTEEALIESQTQVLTVMNSTNDLIWSVDSERFGLLTWNRALRDYFFNHRGIEVTIGMSPAELLPHDYAAQWCEFYACALRDGSFSTEYEVVAKTNVLLLSLHVLKRGSSVFGISVFGKDITERKRTEEEIFRLREEYTHIARVSTMGELTASLAHELKQPLAAIRSNAQAALRFLTGDKPDIAEVHEVLKDIIVDNRRADDVIKKLRSLMRKSEVHITELNMKELVEDILPLVTSHDAMRKISLHLKLDDNIPLAAGNRIQLQQVILNLILNSTEALMITKKQSRSITVRMHRQDNRTITLSVKDNGPGIEAKVMPHLFEPFYTTKPEGLGMGLAICRSIVETHGGRLWAENNPDGGATFYFTIPIAREN